MNLKDSLESIIYPVPVIKKVTFEKTIIVSKQNELESLGNILKDELEKGYRNIEIRISGNGLVAPEKAHPIYGLDYSDANICISCNLAMIMPDGIELKRNNSCVYREGKFWVAPFDQFDLGNVIIDKKGNELSLGEEVREAESLIEPLVINGQKTWRMQTDLPDVDENKSKDFYIAITRVWTSTRHQVLKVNDGWLYFSQETTDPQSRQEPNVDYKLYGIHTRYQLINSPVSKGVHIVDGKIYIPRKYGKIKINKGGSIIQLSQCHFNSCEITSFRLNGYSKSPFSVFNCTFDEGLFVHHNSFTNLASLALSTIGSENVCFCDNKITNARGRTIGFNATNFTICRNHLKNIGSMYNINAIAAGGERVHICDNIIEDFNYSAINCGSRAASRDSVRLTYIIEHNVIKLGKEYRNDYVKNTLADGGAIYIGPSCTYGIIRHNVIQDIKGIDGNRGIFLDDGVKNLAIYGNLIINTENYYDIDLRRYDKLKSEIPDYNTNNSIFNNIITGGYRFEDTGKDSHCIGGQNILLGIGPYQNNTIDLMNKVDDIYLNKCTFSNGKVVIPRGYKEIINSLVVDSLLYKFIVFK